MQYTVQAEDFCAFVLRWPVLAAPLETPGEGKVGKGVGERGREKIGKVGKNLISAYAGPFREEKT
jgi:hypothetical protein